ncbi:MAG: hypothetical protein LBG86_00370 [Puniceicoccales bacterium]|nr:hypothetical protein [Puniceicoccales bacterium]
MNRILNSNITADRLRIFAKIAATIFVACVATVCVTFACFPLNVLVGVGIIVTATLLALISLCIALQLFGKISSLKKKR